ncbi:MAG: CbiX/SirB N-terminal domain-containing protein [Corynebacterium sp.]|uniref:sirohydrochlorin chelatase n=1 Tax=Corynebacterium sp. TaxID=1720 RepID=UPI0026DB7D50|nr:CbiX/SirB N-terminal domain-containing protein [Corynebacterium sp.]MDO5097494.1 CbiX/SirB N-terminal domain-containing protein [Corynebacterium sp.]
MTATVLLAHGSRHPLAAAGIRQLTAAVRQRTETPVYAAHLDFHEDSLPSVSAAIARAGHESAQVIPLLFTDAYHHKVDVPEIAASCDIPLSLRPYLGTGPEIAELLARRVPAGAQPVVYAVGSRDEAANASVEKLAATIGGTALFATRRGGRLPCGRVHVVPLFVTHGLLLDALVKNHPPSADLSYSPPLITELAEIVGRRIRCS